jgi:DsbC/DsbD-like thiol-disulfide interchange protein
VKTIAFAVALSTVAFAQAVPTLQFRGAQGSAHATISASPVQVGAPPGGKLALFVDVTPKPGLHVYAPGTKDYIPITVKLEPQQDVRIGKLTYPKSETMTFDDEKVPVFQKPFRLTQDVVLGKSVSPGSTVTIAGTVHLQACDDHVCFPPENVPVSWTVTVK